MQSTSVRVAEIFERVVEAHADQRDDILDQECGDDKALRDRVRRLLDNDARGHRLDTSEAFSHALQTVNDLPERTRIGAFEITRRLGGGGMGVVFLARRVDGEFEQQVAIKLLQRGLDHRRLRVERDILAQLKHPNIASVIDGGVLDDGRPYVAMEYVDGVHLTAYCAAENLGLRQRLQVFNELCAAVAHAHQNLVVHRDLKPGNILVEADGTLKLLDFGIARLLQDDPDQTQTVGRRLTPAYASPEQLSGAPVSTRSDIYSLGVVLYELLCGRRPFAELECDSRELEKAILQRTPPLPSRASGHSWSRSLRGDLDKIVMKALSTDMTQRYASVGELADDLQRFTEGRPVRARRASAFYRVRKFVGRHRLAVAATLVVVALVLLSQHRIVLERDIAARERDTANAIKNFLVQLFRVSDPGQARGNSVTAREMLDRGADRIRTEFSDQPIVRAELSGTIGVVYQELGLYESALPLLEEALELRRDANDSLETARALVALATLRYYRGQYAAGDPLAREALDIFQRTHEADHTDTADALELLAVLVRFQGDLDAAEPLFRENLRIRQALLEPGHELGDSLNNLAGLLRARGNYSEAIGMYREAVANYQVGLGQDHPAVARGLTNLGLSLQQAGIYDEAESAYREALALRLRSLSADHPQVANSLGNLGMLLVELERIEEAEPLLRQSLDIRRQTLGESHPRVADSWSYLGHVRLARGQAAEARDHYQRAHDILRATHGDDNWRVYAMNVYLAKAAIGGNDLSTARELTENGLAGLDATLGADHPETLFAAGTLGDVLAALGEFAAAERLLLQEFERVNQQWPKKAADSRQRLAQLYTAWGRPDVAARYRQTDP